MNPGIYPNLSNEEYHGSVGLSSSALKLLLANPSRYEYEYLKGNKKAATPALVNGTLLHDLILEPGLLQDCFAVAPDVDRRTKEGKAAHADFLAESEGKTILTAADFDMVLGMADAVLAHPTARKILESARCEESIYWTEQDELAKCRPDIWRPEISVCGDLKSTVSADPDKFLRQSYNLGYHISAAWYLRGIEAETGERPQTWAWIAVEKDAPYPVVVFTASDELLAKGDEECDRAIEIYKRCRDSGHWPAYTDRIIELELPRWAA